MKVTDGVTLLLALLGVFQNHIAFATPFAAPADNFSIDLPPGWVQIPTAYIQQAEQEVAHQAPNSRLAHPDYAFQLGNRDRWFTYPYVLVRVDHRGRIPEPELAKANSYSRGAATAKAQKAMEGLAGELDIGKMRYDPESHVLWFNTSSNVTGVGQVLSTSAIIPTQYGHIDVSGYALERDFLAFSEVFRDLVNSVSPDASAKYQTSFVDQLPFGFKLESLLTSAIGGAFLAVLGAPAWRRKR